MRLKALQLTGFAGVPGELSIDLGADVTIILGANGFGKTTICDAIAWAFTGVHPRGADPRCLYGDSGETAVSLTLIDFDNVITVTRRVTNPNEQRADKLETDTVLNLGGHRVRGKDAEAWLERGLMPPNASQEALLGSATLVDSFYLQQESLRSFLTSRSDDERFAALSRIVGAGALSELVRGFDTAKAAWTRALNKADEELNPSRRRVEQLRQQLAQLDGDVAAATAPALMERFVAWSVAVDEALGLEDPDHTLDSEQVRLRRRALDGRLQLLDDRLQTLRELTRQLELPQPPAPTESDLHAVATDLDARRVLAARAAEAATAAREAVTVAETTARQLADVRRELATMAELATRHVTEVCPTCGQHVNPADLRQRLQGIISEATDTSPVPELVAAQSAMEATELALMEARRAVLSAERQQTLGLEARAAAAAYWNRRLELWVQVGLDPAGVDSGRVAEMLDTVAQHISYSESDTLDLQSLAREADLFASVARVRAHESMRGLLQDQISSAELELQAAEADLRSRRNTGDAADLLARAFRSDSETFLNDRLAEIQPVLDQLYSSIDPHPTLRGIRLTTRQHYGKNRLSPVLFDDQADVTADDPGHTLSTSQANAVAVSLFLAFNLGLAPHQFASVVLDDPLQNLDDLHLLGLVDLLRRLTPYRQLVITTHDAAFASLLTRKLRPVSATASMRILRIADWGRNGPVLHAEPIATDETPMKIAVG